MTEKQIMEKIEDVIQENGISRWQLASLMDVHGGTISNWRAGRTMISLRYVVKMMECFGYEVKVARRKDHMKRCSIE